MANLAALTVYWPDWELRPVKISRFMREIPNQKVSLAGNQHDADVSTLNSFHRHGQHHIKEVKECFSSDFLIVVAFKYI